MIYLRWQAPFCWFLPCQCLQRCVRPLSHLWHYRGAWGDS
uniref:Uncharacterized protein n=1 Tax=Triticum urartu TaxID=4572 RepID=A0A8R7JWD2_TRIUA